MSGPESWRSWEGRTVEGKFPLKQWLGASDHSAVFATEMPAGTRKAIKLIVSDADAEKTLANWRAAAQLSHPNLIRIFDAGRWQANGTAVLYVVMELAEEDLSQILPERALAPDEVGQMLPPLLNALAYVHEKNLAHSRIKPSNVLAIGDHLKLSADQIAPANAPPSDARRRDVYDAPEAAAGIVSPAGDIWSLGVTLVAALTQNVALTEQPGRDPNPPQAIPEPFRGIAKECLHLDPARRCSIAEIEARLRPAGRSVPAAAVESSAAEPRRSQWPVTAAILGVAALVSLIIFYSGHKSTPPQPAASSSQTQSAPESSQPPPFQEPAKTPDTAGVVAHQVLPEVSSSARNTITGTIKVAVRVDVDAAGKVSAAKISSRGPSEYFANAAIKAARQWKFSAPVHDGQPAESAWLLHFHFRRSGTQTTYDRLKR